MTHISISKSLQENKVKMTVDGLRYFHEAFWAIKIMNWQRQASWKNSLDGKEMKSWMF